MARIKVRRLHVDHRHRILEVFTKIYEKNDLPENDYKIFAEKLMRVPALNRRFAGTGPEGNHRLRILALFTTIYKKNNLAGNQYDIFVRELMGVPALNFPYHRAWSRYRAAKAFKKGPIVPGGVLVVPEPTDSDEESEPRSISPESREAGNPHVIDLTTEA